MTKCKYGNRDCVVKSGRCGCLCYTSCDFYYDTTGLPRLSLKDLTGRWFQLVRTPHPRQAVNSFNTSYKFTYKGGCLKAKGTTYIIRDGLFKKFTVFGKGVPLNNENNVLSLNFNDATTVQPNFIIIYYDGDLLISTNNLKQSVEIIGRCKTLTLEQLSKLITFLTERNYCTSDLIFTFQSC